MTRPARPIGILPRAVDTEGETPPTFGKADPPTEAELRERLTPEQFEVTRRGATEPPFTGEHYRNRAPGEYRCVCCGALLFASDDKYDSGSGWPSFTRPAEPETVGTQADGSLGMARTEAVCRKCGAHLGHVFPDGPREATGERWCINSAALAFCPAAGAGGAGGD